MCHSDRSGGISKYFCFCITYQNRNSKRCLDFARHDKWSLGARKHYGVGIGVGDGVGVIDGVAVGVGVEVVVGTEVIGVAVGVGELFVPSLDGTVSNITIACGVVVVAAIVAVGVGDGVAVATVIGAGVGVGVGSGSLL